MTTNKLHLDIKQWLCHLDLSEYHELLNRYNGVEDLLWISERDLKEAGIKNGAHRARMISSLVMLKEKYERGNSKSQSPWSSPLRSRNNSLQESSTIQRNRNKGSYDTTSRASSSPLSSQSSSKRNSMEPSSEPEVCSDELKKALEWELGLESTDLRSWAWYHGTISRERAEELVVEDGYFLVRDCISQPGDYVLTCCWKQVPLHFVIKKDLFKPGTVYEKVQFQIECESFDTVSDLITYYVGSKTPVSSNAGVIVSHPIPRSFPLTFYASCFVVSSQGQYSSKSSDDCLVDQQSAIKHTRSNEIINDKKSKNQKLKINIPMNKSKSEEIKECGNEIAPDNSQTHVQPLLRGMIRVGSDPMLSPTMERRTWEYRPLSGTMTRAIYKLNGEQTDKPPPKPSRIPSRRCAQRPLVVKRSNSNIVKINNEIDEQQSSSVKINFECGRRMSGETRFSFLDQHTTSEDNLDTSCGNLILPPLNPPSCFQFNTFTTSLLCSENKPLDSSVLHAVNSLLTKNTPNMLAQHLTKTDLDVIKINQDYDFGVGVQSGFELILLPQGKQLRMDLLERLKCLQLFVATTILMCSKVEDRADVINKWIQIAIETKNSLGNLFSFAGIMQGLTLPQISRLQLTWLCLRQEYTENAFAFETKLRPALRTMQECTPSPAPNICIPYVSSLITILQSHLNLVHKENFQEVLQKENNLELGFPWEQSSADYGIHLVMEHLELGRQIMQQYTTFIRNSELALNDVQYDSSVLDVFKTEFHMKFLWGSRGALAKENERHSKFQQLLSLLSHRCENS